MATLTELGLAAAVHQSTKSPINRTDRRLAPPYRLAIELGRELAEHEVSHALRAVRHGSRLPHRSAPSDEDLPRRFAGARSDHSIDRVRQFTLAAGKRVPGVSHSVVGQGSNESGRQPIQSRR